jgi:lipoprotein-anchoring transpeptidase ErfK/SrfK
MRRTGAGLHSGIGAAPAARVARAMRRHPGRPAAIAAGLLTLVLAGCSGGGGGGTTTISNAADSGNGGAATGPGTTNSEAAGDKANSTPKAPPAKLTFSPANGAKGVSPTSPISVTASGGKLTTVTVTNESGKPVKGTLSADGLSWKSSQELGYNKTYSVKANATNTDGAAARVNSSFSTVQPVTFTMPYLFPDGLKTVGVGQPITVHFDEAIKDKATAEKALSVTTSPHVDGGWYWFDSQNVHWRPKNYWTPGTRVTVTANVYGVNVGNGIYGQQDVSSTFKIGPSRITTIDDNTHLAIVKINGKTVRTMPVSMGKGGCEKVAATGRTVCYTTHSGPHVVQEKYPVKKMSSASFGLPVDAPGGYEEDISLATRISADGEFMHSAPWSVGAQGHRNTSHGCVNLSPDNAQWFYSTMTYGDVVDIKNTGVALPADDKYGDWTVPWSQWRAGSALT